jgi:tryptophanyl-tRNA synthetase
MKTVFSGIQPSGELHLGNYLGAIRNWVALQDTYFCYFCVVDYHAITQDYVRAEMKARVRDMAIDLLACGIDPDRSVLFVQSHVAEHTELCWVLNAVTPFGDLSRMTQFKDKSKNQSDNINVGLFDYPVLQAADILLYRAVAVPVGEDQVQHLELSRRIARGFNRRWGKVFPEPEPVLSSTPKILGLDGQAKMSKSLGNTIALGATDKQIRKSLARAATDPARVTREDPGDPDKCNVYTIHQFFSSEDDKAWVREGCTTAGIGCVDCKTRLADNVIAHLGPIRERRAELAAEPGKVDEILAAGADKAAATAQSTMAEVRKKLGLYPRGGV